MKWSFLAVAAALGAGLLLLQATAGEKAVPGCVRLVWATDDNPVRQEQMALFREWYRQKYGQPIDIRIDPSNSTRAKVVVQSVAGSGPDLFDYFGAANLQGYVDSGIVLDVSDDARRLGFAPGRFWPVLENSLAARGRQYGVPDNAVGSLILVRRDLLAAKGLALPQAGWNWADLVRLAQALTERDDRGRVIRFGLLEIKWINLVLQNGGACFNAAGTRCVLGSPATVEALRFYEDLKGKYHAMPSASEASSLSGDGGYGAGSLNLFASGQGAMLEFGRYGYIVLNRIGAERKRAGLPPLDVVPLPPLTGKRTAVTANARCTGVNRRTPHREEALRFLEFLSGPAFNAQVNRAADSLNAVPGDATGPDGITGGRPFRSGCDDPAWVEAIRQGVPSPSSPFVNGTVLLAILKEEVDRLDSGLQDPAQTAARMERRVNQAIADYLRNRPELRREWESLDSPNAPEARS